MRCGHQPAPYQRLQQCFRFGDNVVNGEAELFKQLLCRRRLTEGGHANDGAVQANVFEPVVRDELMVFRCGKHGEFAYQLQYGFTIGRILLVERVGGRHGDHARLHAFSGQFVPRGNRQFHF